MAVDVIASSGSLRKGRGAGRHAPGRAPASGSETEATSTECGSTDVAPSASVDGSSDADLVARMAGGDREAHRLLYERHATGLLRYLIGRLGGNRSLAEETLQEVMIAAWQGAAGFRGQSRVRTWLFGIAHHRAANLVRKRKRELLREDPTSEPAAQPGGHQESAAGRAYARADHRIDLDRALRALPESQRSALELVFYHGLSVVEVADVLSVAPGTVKSRLFRAKASLREHLALREDRDHA